MTSALDGIRHAPWENSGVVSLKDLLAYASEVFCLLTDILGRVQGQLFWQVGMAMSNTEYRNDLLMKLAASRELCVQHGWIETAEQIIQVEEYIVDAGMMPVVLQSKCADLERHLFRLLNDNLFFHADKDRLTDWNKWSEAFKNWRKSFPRSLIEMHAAKECYLFGQSSASVFHSMRALEIGLTAFAQKLNVPVKSRDQWEVVINNIEAQIKNMNGPHAGPDWKQKQEQYSEAALHFRFLKNAWRNHIMHVRHTYKLPKALEIMGHSSEFIQALKDIGLQEPDADKFFTDEQIA